MSTKPHIAEILSVIDQKLDQLLERRLVRNLPGDIDLSDLSPIEQYKEFLNRVERACKIFSMNNERGLIMKADPFYVYFLGFRNKTQTPKSLDNVEVHAVATLGKHFYAQAIASYRETLQSYSGIRVTALDFIRWGFAVEHEEPIGYSVENWLDTIELKL